MNTISHLDRIRHLSMEPSREQAQRRELSQPEPKQRQAQAERLIHPFDAVDAELLRARQIVATGIYRIG